MTKDILETYNKLLNEIDALRDEQSALPKGTLRVRSIKGKDYYYLQHRDGKHVRSTYIKREDVPAISNKIDQRNRLREELKTRKKRLAAYEKLLGKHRTYRPVKDIDYKEYTLFMSTLAHDFKRLGQEGFLEKYDLSKHRGLNKRYLRGFMDYIGGIENRNARKTNDLVLDPYTHLMYFKYGDKTVLKNELEKAIPAFLNQGLLVTSVQEAVRGSFDNRGISQ